MNCRKESLLKILMPGNSFPFVNNMPDILAQLNRQVYVRCLQPSTIYSIHTFFHQVLDMAVDNDYFSTNLLSNVLRELKHPG